MSVPSYQLFIDPVLRYLASRKGSVSSAEVHDAVAIMLKLDNEDRALRLSSGKFTYKDRAGWAFSRLKHAGLASAPEHGNWQITETGRELAVSCAQLSEKQIAELATGPRAATQSRAPSTAKSSTSPERQQATLGDRKAYRLPPQPLARGGQAEVYEAIRKSDRKVFAFKRVLGQSRVARMRREIEVQRSLSHPNIMPIVDWDNEFTWYVMPKGKRSMWDLTLPIDDTLLCVIVSSVASALELAHAKGYPHRDVKPHNIIEIPTAEHVTEWVLGDWGLTRRPLGETTTGLTKTGQGFGTEGFAPPESYLDAHQARDVWDIFSLGQVIAWAKGAMPVPNSSATAPGPWRQLVEDMTALDPSARIQTIAEIRRLLPHACSLST